MDGDTAPSNSFASVRIVIPNPSSAQHKSSSSIESTRQSATVSYITTTGHRWESTSAIDAIVLTPQVGSNFKAGTYCLIKGFKSQTVVTAASGGTHNLLDGSIHPDTLAGTVVKGDLIVGNATPKWSRFAVSGIANGSVLTRNSSATVGVEWAAATDPLARHVLCGGI